jgi:hypothetical protein
MEGRSDSSENNC